MLLTAASLSSCIANRKCLEILPFLHHTLPVYVSLLIVTVVVECSRANVAHLHCTVPGVCRCVWPPVHLPACKGSHQQGPLKRWVLFSCHTGRAWGLQERQHSRCNLTPHPVLLGMAAGTLTLNGMQRLPVTAGTAVMAATLAMRLQVYPPACFEMIKSQPTPAQPLN